VSRLSGKAPTHERADAATRTTGCTGPYQQADPDVEPDQNNRDQSGVGPPVPALRSSESVIQQHLVLGQFGRHRKQQPAITGRQAFVNPQQPGRRPRKRRMGGHGNRAGASTRIEQELIRLHIQSFSELLQRSQRRRRVAALDPRNIGAQQSRSPFNVTLGITLGFSQRTNFSSDIHISIKPLIAHLDNICGLTDSGMVISRAPWLLGAGIRRAGARQAALAWRRGQFPAHPSGQGERKN
jgi:hypothetical protein